MIHGGTHKFGSPFKATVVHRGVKASGDSSKAKSDIRRSDPYLVISNLCKLCKEMNFVLVMTICSISSVFIAAPEGAGISCGWFLGAGVSSFPWSFPAHLGFGSGMTGVCTLSCRIGRSINGRQGLETHGQGTRCLRF